MKRIFCFSVVLPGMPLTALRSLRLPYRWSNSHYEHTSAVFQPNHVVTYFHPRIAVYSRT